VREQAVAAVESEAAERLEELKKTHEEALEAERRSHAAQRATLQVALDSDRESAAAIVAEVRHGAALQHAQREREHKEAIAALRAERDNVETELVRKQEEQVEAHAGERRADAELKAQALADAADRHATEVAALREEHRLELAHAADRAAVDLEAAQRRGREEADSLQEKLDTAVTRAEALEHRLQELAAQEAEREQRAKLERKRNLAAADEQRKAELGALRQQLEADRDRTLEEEQGRSRQALQAARTDATAALLARRRENEKALADLRATHAANVEHLVGEHRRE